ncbi:NifB/NifX family molybdenum-iron cluster-binding protein [Acetobacterium malicum]|uniref:NifB/NifX family molybdenum-iron cluster-binding protein n=1 Tax=Acetobacterium malicum TaxID=52692 RepID=UPI0004223FD0|nr:NifB/NifX family molybdenum-iron cluster-binding protein [Acetobacterium dehalogenans]
MKIAMTMDGTALESAVSSEFDSSPYLLVVRRSETAIEAIEEIGDLTAEQLAQKIIDLNCEGIITGNFKSQPAFDLLADAGLTRFQGVGHSGREALELMKQRTLPLIRNFAGTEGCSDDHH